MSENPFKSHATPHPGTCDNALAVSPSDDTDLPIVPSIIWLGTPGNLRVTMLNDEIVTLKMHTAASFGYLPVRAKRIHATGTTASDIVILW